VVAPKLSLADWASDKLQIVMPAAEFSSRHIPLSLEWMTEKMAWELEQRLGSKFKRESSSKIGEGRMRHQLAIDMQHPSESDALITPKDFSDRWLVPASARMANEVGFRKIESFGELEIPMSVQEACNVRMHDSGVCVRGVSVWHPGDIWTPPRQLIRFDVLVG